MRPLLYFLIILMSVFAAWAHEGHHHGEGAPAQKRNTPDLDRQKVYQEIQTEYAANVQGIFEKKCAPCHARTSPLPWYGDWPLVGRLIASDRREAQEHLEISQGFPFAGHGSVDEDFEALQKSVEKDNMPTSLYKMVHPSSRLTDSEKAQILAWIEKSRQRLQRLHF